MRNGVVHRRRRNAERDPDENQRNPEQPAPGCMVHDGRADNWPKGDAEGEAQVEKTQPEPTRVRGGEIYDHDHTDGLTPGSTDALENAPTDEAAHALGERTPKGTGGKDEQRRVEDAPPPEYVAEFSEQGLSDRETEQIRSSNPILIVRTGEVSRGKLARCRTVLTCGIARR